LSKSENTLFPFGLAKCFTQTFIHHQIIGAQLFKDKKINFMSHHHILWCSHCKKCTIQIYSSGQICYCVQQPWKSNFRSRITYAQRFSRCHFFFRRNKIYRSASKGIKEERHSYRCDYRQWKRLFSTECETNHQSEQLQTRIL